MKPVAGICVVWLMTGACQLSAGAQQPALLMQGDGAALDRLKVALAREMGRTAVDIGPSDPTRSSVISVLPLPAGPLNDRDLSLPTVFRLESDGRACALVREDTGRRIDLAGVTCRAASAQ